MERPLVVDELNLTKEEENLTLEEFLKARYERHVAVFDASVEQGIENFLKCAEMAKQELMRLRNDMRHTP